MRRYALAAACFVGLAGGPAEAARCGGDFNGFVASMASEAQGAGVSASVTSAAFSGITQDGAVLAFDRRQRYTFNKSFEQYVSTRVGPGRINGGRALLQGFIFMKTRSLAYVVTVHLLFDAVVFLVLVHAHNPCMLDHLFLV